MTRRVSRRAGDRVLAIDTATEEAVVAIGDAAGAAIASERWRAGHLHGERLLGSIERTLAAARSPLGALAAIVVGTGPGSFTGLRVGLATAKGLAFGLRVPIVGIETAVALAAASRASVAGDGNTLIVVLLPAGPGGRYRAVVEVGGGTPGLVEPAAFLAPGDEPPTPAGARILAVDLPGAPAGARAAGERARRGLGEALLLLGTRRLASFGPDDLAGLVPTYVTLPRGITVSAGSITWSHDVT